MFAASGLRGTALRHSLLSADFDDQLDEVQDFRILHSACDLAQQYVVSNIIEVLGQKARFHIYSHANALALSRDELEAEDVLDLGDAAAKKESGQDWYQVVAVKDNDTILRRVLLSDGGAMIHRDRKSTR